ncbi:hypothetical protein [Winogradskyella flava]|uniref:hypothetical protein n=1 Tax=Winogradskyella flava TaxID=1884876 RepID=UPI001FE44A03|nr:hypothetical protein [Winogradskyella flava]
MSGLKSLHKYQKLLILLVLSISSSCAYESQNREKLVSSFEDNFGFKPPESIKEIKLKNRGYFDFQVHYMSFTYDSDVLEKIIAHDQPLNVVERNNVKFEIIIEDLKKDPNYPKWFDIPDKNIDRIYYKTDFLDHTFSEYYLWTDKKTAMTYLYVHFFD